jgi:tripartite-type tricarboxylate transporter receptor subunit TctC
MSFSSLGAALPLMQDNRIRAIAVTSRDRMPQLPNVAPLSDAPGLAGYELLNWFAVFAPAATPEPILAKLSQVVQDTLNEPSTAKRLDIQGIVPRKMGLAELRTFVRAESEKFGKIIQDANIKLGN